MNLINVEQNFYELLNKLTTYDPNTSYNLLNKKLIKQINSLELDLNTIKSKKDFVTCTPGGEALKYRSDLSIILSGVNSGKSMQSLNLIQAKGRALRILTVQNKIDLLINLYQYAFDKKINIAKIILNKFKKS